MKFFARLKTTDGLTEANLGLVNFQLCQATLEMARLFYGDRCCMSATTFITIFTSHYSITI